MSEGLKHIVINDKPYLVEEVVYDWHLALCREREWQPIETAPWDKSLLLWWVPKDPNTYAECCVIGVVCARDMEGQWYNGQLGNYQDVKHVTHWMPLPSETP